MRKVTRLLLCLAVLSTGLSLPTQVRAEDRNDPFDVYAKFARKIVQVTMRGTKAVKGVAAEAILRIRRLQENGQHERAREMAAKAINSIERYSAKTRSAIRETASRGVDALLKFEGNVPPDVLRNLVEGLLDLAERAADHVDGVEKRAINAIESLFPQPTPVSDRR